MKKYIFIFLLILNNSSMGIELFSTVSSKPDVTKNYVLFCINRIKKDISKSTGLNWRFLFSPLDTKYVDFRLYSLEKKRRITISEYFDGDINKYNEAEDLLFKRINYFLPKINTSNSKALFVVKETVSFLSMGFYSSKVESFLKDYLLKNKDLVKQSTGYSVEIYEHLEHCFKLCLLGLGNGDYREELYKYLEKPKNNHLAFHGYFVSFLYASGKEPFEARDYALSLLASKKKVLAKRPFVLMKCVDVIFGTDRDLKFVENMFLDKDFYANTQVYIQLLKLIESYRQKISNETVVEKIYQLTFSKHPPLRHFALYTLLQTFTKDKAWVERELPKATDPERKKTLESYLNSPTSWREGYSFGPIETERKKQINALLRIKKED